jgi:hypothetical protein
MSTILYYSNYCNNSKSLLKHLSKLNSKEIHYICIDKRIKKQKATYIVLQDNQEILLPPSIDKVPALLLLNKGNHVLFELDIVNYIQEHFVKDKQIQEKVDEPENFMFGDGLLSNIKSDSYSFLDQCDEDLSTKGDGGMRQPHHYASINASYNIDTPPDNYEADKIGNIPIDELQQKREHEMK